MFLKHSLASFDGRARLSQASRASIGAVIGIAATGLVTSLALGPTTAMPMLIAPMGASAVLLFAAPASPLAQPWSVLGGNTIAAIVGVTVAGLIADPIAAASVALGVAILAMVLLGCLHPPSGAVALTAVLGGEAVLEAAYGFVIWPVVVNSVLLLGAALAFNRLLRKQQKAVRVKSIPPLDATPAHLHEMAHIRHYRREAGIVACATIMKPIKFTLKPDTPLAAAWGLLQAHGLRAAPVISDEAQLVGIISRTDFYAAGAVLPNGKTRRSVLPGKTPRVSDVMTTRVQSALPETPIEKLVSPMVDQNLHQIPIVNAANRVVGMVGQPELLNGLFRMQPERADGAIDQRDARNMV